MAVGQSDNGHTPKQWLRTSISRLLLAPSRQMCRTAFRGYFKCSPNSQIQGTRIDLPIEATGPRIVDLIGQYKDRDKRDQLTVVLDNRLALVCDNLCKEGRLAFSIKTMPVKYRPGRKNKGSIFA